MDKRTANKMGASKIIAPEFENAFVTCGKCTYWRSLGSNEPEAWGSCTWFDWHDIENIPYWSKVMVSTGSISPKQRSLCAVFEQA